MSIAIITAIPMKNPEKMAPRAGSFLKNPNIRYRNPTVTETIPIFSSMSPVNGNHILNLVWNNTEAIKKHNKENEK